MRPGSTAKSEVESGITLLPFRKVTDLGGCLTELRISYWSKKKVFLRRKIHFKDIGLCSFRSLDLDTCQPWTRLFWYFVHLYLITLSLQRSGDIEANPGPVGLEGICRGCGSENVEGKECLKVQYFIDNYLGALEMAFHHGELLVSDNEKNPKFFCSGCAKHIRGCNTKQKQNQAKRVKMEKRFLITFLPSESDCDIKRCDHLQISISEMKLQWQKASERTQCQMMAFIASDIKGKISEDYANNIEKQKPNGIFLQSMLEDMDPLEYLRCREKRLLTFILGLSGRSLTLLGDQLPKVIGIIDTIYSLSINAVMPFKYNNYRTRTSDTFFFEHDNNHLI